MKIKELFTIGDMIQSIGGTATFLDRDNCQVENKRKIDNAIALTLKRQSDGEEGHAYLRVRSEFSQIADQLLDWAFASELLMGLSLNQLGERETGLNVHGLNGKLMLDRRPL